MAVELYLQNSILTEKKYENEMFDIWKNHNFKIFSKNKELYDYQQQALSNALTALYWFYSDEECNGNKEYSLGIYKIKGFKKEHLFNINSNKKYEILNDFSFKIDGEGNVYTSNFINRMSFWMATGSGKTLVIVKLLEMLANLIKNRLIPKNEILFLTYRDDLIEQFKAHVEEYNSHFENPYKIDLHELRRFADVKNTLYGEVISGNKINVFYYRSDLIDVEQKEKKIDFRSYDNQGKWYIILDEAHKGDKEDSKRQLYYSILSRNGFLFNFSATFTDELDYATCVYNFNLQKFIEEGYGKHIYLSPIGVSELGNKDVDKKYEIEIQRKKLTLIFLLHAYLKKLYKNILQDLNQDCYHSPLILTLVNSVNTEDADLKLFFEFLSEFASCNFTFQINPEDLVNQAKVELIEELYGKKAKLQLENLNLFIDTTLISNLTYKDVLKEVFNTETCGGLEIIKIPNNKQELLLKAKNSDKPFALIKIGDISEWLKNLSVSQKYEIIEQFESEKVFANLNQDKDINILMGSRAFYEGWDSPRPNIILYINIGQNIDAKKFILQSIGRGIRIQPLPNMRRRFEFLKDLQKKITDLNFKNTVMPLETLFVYGTKKDAIEKIIETLEEQKESEIFEIIELNPELKDKLLLVPDYDIKHYLNTNLNFKIKLSKADADLLCNYYDYLGEKIFLLRHNLSVQELKLFKELITNRKIILQNTDKTIGNIDVIISKIKSFANLTCHILNKQPFRDLDRNFDIVHFKKISITAEKYNKIKSLIVDKTKEEREQIIGNFLEKQKIKVEHIITHYYIPIYLSKDEKVSFMKHIIKTQSEIDFIYDLVKYSKKKDNLFNEFEWWYFSKIDESLDNIYIPYYEDIPTKTLKFKPDFIFWLKRKDCNDYFIVFVDPKSLGARDQEYKVSGYKKLFRKQNKENELIKFSYLNNDSPLNIYVFLFLYNKEVGKVSVPSQVANFWVKSVEDMMKMIVDDNIHTHKLF